MRIMVMGGGGDEAEAFVKDLFRFYEDEISQVVLADRREERCKLVGASIGSKKISTRYLDALDYPRLVKAMKNVDLIINYVGPFYRMGTRVLKAAIEAKKNYIDIDDDTESTLQKLNLDKDAREAGITAIVGLGSGPGSDNLLAKHGASKLDRVDEINIYWVASLRSTESSRVVPAAAGRHAFHGIQVAGPQFINGEFVKVSPLSGATWVDFGPPVGRAEVVYFGHPEAVTLPRYIKGLKKCTNRGGFLPHFRMKRIRQAIELGLACEEPIDVEGHLVSPIDVLLALENTFIPDECLGEPVSGIRIEIKGEKDGRPKEIVYGGSSTNMANATSAPTSIGVNMLAQGEIKVKGVYAPEGCIDDFRKFMSELKKRQI